MGTYSVKLVNLVSVVSCNMVKLFNQLQVIPKQLQLPQEGESGERI
jgi:hypothetical protein